MITGEADEVAQEGTLLPNLASVVDTLLVVFDAVEPHLSDE